MEEKVGLEFIHNLLHKHSFSTYSVPGIEGTKLIKLWPQRSRRNTQSLGGGHAQFSVTPLPDVPTLTSSEVSPRAGSG